MPELHIRREHRLGLKAARAAAHRWTQEAEREWGMQCRTEPGSREDQIHFERTGVSGCLTVGGDRFDLQVKLHTGSDSIPTSAVFHPESGSLVLHPAPQNGHRLELSLSLSGTPGFADAFRQQWRTD